MSIFALVVMATAVYFTIWRPARQERNIRLTLKNSGCEKARGAGLLPATEPADAKVCRTVVFAHRGTINDDPLEISFNGKTVEFPISEIAMIDYAGRE